MSCWFLFAEVRSWPERSRALLWSCALFAGCAHADQASREPAHAVEARDEVVAAEANVDAGKAPIRVDAPEARAQLEACYAAAQAKQPGLSVHTTALYFARAGRIVFADVELPEQPELVRCFLAAITTWHTPELPRPELPDSLATGGFGIDFGPPREGPRPMPSRLALEERFRRVKEEAFRSGALPRDDPEVQRAFAPAPPWPNATHQAQMQDCYAAAVRDHPGLVLHRQATYLARGGAILLVDVRVPEAPELAACLKQRIVSWRSPFPPMEQTVISSFFIDLGGSPEFPAAEGDLCAHLARRDALVAEAVRRKLMAADDPLIAQLKQGRPAHAPNGRACTETASDAGA